MEKGYDLVFLGFNGLFGDSDELIKDPDGPVAAILPNFDGVTAIAAAIGRRQISGLNKSPNILLPITGTDYSTRAAEIAVAIAKGSKGTVTALHVAPPAKEIDVLRRPNEVLAAGRHHRKGNSGDRQTRRRDSKTAR